jgi:hypothetical protein
VQSAVEAWNGKSRSAKACWSSAKPCAPIDDIGKKKSEPPWMLLCGGMCREWKKQTLCKGIKGDFLSASMLIMIWGNP